MIVIAMTGKDGGELAKVCDHEIRVPWDGYSDRIQGCTLWHTLHYFRCRISAESEGAVIINDVLRPLGLSVIPTGLRLCALN